MPARTFCRFCRYPPGVFGAYKKPKVSKKVYLNAYGCPPHCFPCISNEEEGYLQNLRKSRPPSKKSSAHLQAALPLTPYTRCKPMSNPILLEQTIITLGGRITCTRCQARSKRTKQQCRAPASKGKTKCRFHGGASTGPKTEAGRQRCADTKKVHGRETRSIRAKRSEAIARIQALEVLGYALGIIHGPRIRGPKCISNVEFKYKFSIRKIM